MERDRLTILCDATWSTPVLTKPIELGNRPSAAFASILLCFAGVDAVLHSLTKYIGGHSDLVGGMVVTADTESGNRLHTSVN